MIASWPEIAPASPPLTGASRKSTPFASQAAPIFRETAGAMELMSMTTDPGEAPSRTPFSPRMTVSESGESGSMVTTAFRPSALARGESLGSAPSEASSSTGARERLPTAREKPASRRFRAMGFPMIPRPTKPTLRIDVTSSLLRPAARGDYTEEVRGVEARLLLDGRDESGEEADDPCIHDEDRNRAGNGESAPVVGVADEGRQPGGDGPDDRREYHRARFYPTSVLERLGAKHDQHRTEDDPPGKWSFGPRALKSLRGASMGSI